MRKLVTTSIALLVLALLAVPAAAQQNLRRVSPDHLNAYWVRTNMSVDAQVPNSGQGLDKIGCAAVTYVIGTDGETQQVKVAKKYPKSSDFQVTARSMLEGFHYQAARGNDDNEPVTTYFIVPFNVPGGDDATMQKMLDTCHLSGYSD